MSIFKNLKIKAKTFWFIAAITALEIIILLWCNNWQFTPAIIPTFIQFLLVIDHKDVWKKLSDEEKEKVLLSEDDVEGFVRGVKKLCEEGKSTQEILDHIKED